jgi:hypothetical protein
VEILGGTSPEDMDLFMQAINASLGVGCEHCHEQNDPASEARAPKEAARSMMRMIVALSETGFEALDLPTCWTCHRGSPDVPAAPPPPIRAAGEASPFSASAAPARGLYANLELLGDRPGADLEGVMAGFSAALGVGCGYCHMDGDWASDEKLPKLLARRMYEIQLSLNAELQGLSTPIGCWTCHRGDAVPELSVPERLLEPR